ncbi:MAG: hypothetical protein K8T91_01540 [Planctomycetes bacterium]|nr:hypothetical protein [Planctomycetota bacterium]
MEKTTEGTIIRGKFRMHPFVVVFMTIWFGGLTAGGGMMLMAALSELLTGKRIMQGNLSPFLAVFIPPGMILFGIGLVAWGWQAGRRQRERIEEVIETTLQARRIASGHAS